MRRKNSETIGQVLMQYLREEGLETPLNQHRLIDSWTEVMGQGIGRFTNNVFIRNQTLYVQIRSAMLKQNLMMARANLVKKLNDHVGAQVISDIQFY
ncbi:MAG: DUF721 domain-containing protein [Prevotellaceae bacterium]|nr:DUF721 domain-containing protein [Prevotellaceae bacterium]